MLFGKFTKIIPSDKLAETILGGQDGLVNTLGVILGIAAASSDIRIIIGGGLAACIAESISMGAVAYTSQRADRDHYLAEAEKEKKLINENASQKKESVRKIYMEKGFEGRQLNEITKLITSNKTAWLSILLSEESKVAPIATREILTNAFIVFLAALVGALIPLFPFFFFSLIPSIYLSLIFSCLALFVLGYYKAKITVGNPVYSGTELLVIGMSAALVGYAVGYIFR